MQDIRKQNVYDLAQERLRVIFQNFDNIYISFSGGKDSGVLLNLCIDYIRKHNLKRKIGVFHMDYEIQYNMTIDYVERTFKENQDILDIYHVCVNLFRPSAGPRRRRKTRLRHLHLYRRGDRTGSARGVPAGRFAPPQAHGRGQGQRARNLASVA